MEDNTQSTDQSTQETANQDEHTQDENAEENQDTSTEITQNEENENQDDNSETKTDDEVDENLAQTFDTVEASSAGEYNIETNIKALAVIESKIDEANKNNTENSSKFYSELDTHLTKEEKELQFDDNQAPYYQAIENAKKRWEKEQKAPTEELEKELNTAKFNLSVANAIETVLKKHPTYNHVVLKKFYLNDLNKTEQRNLDKGSTPDNLPEYFEKIHKLYEKKNPSKIESKTAPKVPNINQKPKHTIDAAQQLVTEQEDKAHLEKIGFRKL